jgi:hypothetical protein
LITENSEPLGVFFTGKTINCWRKGSNAIEQIVINTQNEATMLESLSIKLSLPVLSRENLPAMVKEKQ